MLRSPARGSGDSGAWRRELGGSYDYENGVSSSPTNQSTRFYVANTVGTPPAGRWVVARVFALSTGIYDRYARHADVQVNRKRCWLSSWTPSSNASRSLRSAARTGSVEQHTAQTVTGTRYRCAREVTHAARGVAHLQPQPLYGVRASPQSAPTQGRAVAATASPHCEACGGAHRLNHRCRDAPLQLAIPSLRRGAQWRVRSALPALQRR